MREALRYPSRLRHIVDSINNVNQYMEGKTESDLVSNSMLFFAVVKNIEIVGEAAYKLMARHGISGKSGRKVFWKNSISSR